MTTSRLHPRLTRAHIAHHARLRPSVSGRTAFTLIELLTVIAIIGILAAIIIPTVGKVRQTAKRAACLSNMRQVGVAIIAFATDNKDWLPGGADKVGQWNLYGLQRTVGVRGWMEGGKGTQDLAAQLFPYLVGPYPKNSGELPRTKILCDPGNSAAGQTYNDSSTPVPSYYAGTGIAVKGGKKRPFGKATGTRAVQLTEIEAPRNAVAIFDVDKQIIANITGEPSVNDAVDAPVHGNTRNFLFLDGHVSAMPLDYKPDPDYHVSW